MNDAEDRWLASETDLANKDVGDCIAIRFKVGGILMDDVGKYEVISTQELFSEG